MSANSNHGHLTLWICLSIVLAIVLALTFPHAAISLEVGGDLYAAVDRALSDAGRAFGAARVFELARAGRYVAAEHDPMLAAFPFRSWSAAEMPSHCCWIRRRGAPARFTISNWRRTVSPCRATSNTRWPATTSLGSAKSIRTA